jgi:acyl-CoA thioesterase FadM
MGRCAWVAGHCVVAGSISVRFHHRVPLGTVLHLEAWVEECQGRKILVQAQMQAPEGDILASSEGTFIQISEEHFQTELRKLEAQGLASQDPGWRHKA